MSFLTISSLSLGVLAISVSAFAMNGAPSSTSLAGPDGGKAIELAGDGGKAIELAGDGGKFIELVSAGDGGKLELGGGKDGGK